MDFSQAVARVLMNEGGYVNNPRDPGGETNWGISKRQYPDLDIKTLTRDQAAAIYLRDYWQRLSADRLPHGLDYQVFDFAVNSGTGTAARRLQRTLGVVEDGNLGPVTLAAIAKQDTRSLVMHYLAERLELWRALSNWQDAGLGWTRRAVENLRFAAADFSTPGGSHG